MTDTPRRALGQRLRRDLGTLQSYATLLGILIGAGIFRVTSDAWQLTGPSVLLAHAVLLVPVLATSVGYAAFGSTSLGRQPGGEYSHLHATFGGPRLASLGAWLKIVSYLGALAYLAGALADYVLPLAPGWLDPEQHRLPLALAALVIFWAVHVVGVRWFGRLQLVMCGVLAVSLVVLIVPGLFAVRAEHYQPFFTHGGGGFMRALVPLFFAYAGFESLAQTAGEVKDAPRRLPGVFLRGVLASGTIFVLMSIVAFGVLPGATLAGSTAPMADVAARYLPAGGAAIVSLGAVMALATSVNATMLVPSRLAWMLARDGSLPAALGRIDARTGTPVLGLTVTLLLSAGLLLSGQVGLALGIAVQALVLLYLLHSLALLVLPRRNPELAAEITSRLSPGLRTGAALLSIVFMLFIAGIQVVGDVEIIAAAGWSKRSPTSTELLLGWTLVGLAMSRFAARRER